MLLKEKVYAYITHRDRLLVFRHIHAPEAGIQVPGGSLEPGETPLQGVLREAREETGLENLVLVSFLGIQELDMTPYGVFQIHRRHFYHLTIRGDPPATWRHDEQNPSDGEPAPIPFEFFWAALPSGVPPLAGQQDALLHRLPLPGRISVLPPSPPERGPG